MLDVQVRIQKERETDLLVIYRFGISEVPMGRLSLRKVDGYVDEMIPVFHPQGRSIFARAMHKVLDHWAVGQYPDLTYWEGDEGRRA